MKIPSFSLPANSGKFFSDLDFQNGTSVLYLYPKDATSGCTLEAKDFRDLLPHFTEIGVRIFGLSKDSPKSHDRFYEKQDLNFPLLSDENTELIRALGSWKEKSMYGKKYWGTDRSTFVIRDGEIIREWRGVSVKNHAEEVLKFCKQL